MCGVIYKDKADDQDQVIDKDGPAQAIKPNMPYLFVFDLFTGKGNKKQAQRHKQSGAHKKKMLAGKEASVSGKIVKRIDHSVHPAEHRYRNVCDY